MIHFAYYILIGFMFIYLYWELSFGYTISETLSKQCFSNFFDLQHPSLVIVEQFVTALLQFARKYIDVIIVIDLRVPIIDF